MNRRLFGPLLLACCCVLPAVALGGLVIPDPAEPVTTDYDLGYTSGVTDGIAIGHEQCRQNPASCSIFLTNVLPPAQYGETEPNDTLISADPLTQSANFWGQSYNSTDQDWFYLVTTEPNYNLTVTFSLPEARTTGCRTVLDDTGNITFDCSCQQATDPATGEDTLLCSLTGWTISIRNAAGMVLAEFDTGFSSVEHAESGINYRTTLGLPGTYYVQVRANGQRFSYQQYNLTVVLEPSPLDSPNFVGGFSDAEIEPNDLPGNGTFIARGVSMYGLVNLRFDSAICDAEQCTYAQNEDDWYIYVSPGNEVLQLAFCDRTLCSPGNWFVQVFDLATADAIMNQGLAPDNATPLMAFNTDKTGEVENDEPNIWRLGLQHANPYFLRIGHQRTLEAPCIEWTTDTNNDGIPDGNRGNCACTDGTPYCQLDILNPGSPTIADVIQVIYPVCPNGTGGGENAYCETQCVCINNDCSLYQTDSDGDGLPGPNPEPCRCLPIGTSLSCTVTLPNPGSPAVIDIPEQVVYPLCPDGSGGSDSPQCEVGCICTDTSGVVRLPADEDDSEIVTTSQYNFTLTSSPFGSP